MEHQAMIELRNISKTYERRDAPVLNDLSAAFAPGEFVSLMGPSGTGKTTLLNLIAGLDRPDKGVVIVNGVNLKTMRDRELSHMRLTSIGFVFQSFNLLPSLNVSENVAWPLEFAGHPRAEVARRVADALERVGVRDCDHRYPAELSGGEQQRVAVARAIATKPRLLLADEPTGNLDSHSGEKILDLLRLLNRTQGVTVLMVTHNVFAATYGHRTIELRDGAIVRDVTAPPCPPKNNVVEMTHR